MKVLIITGSMDETRKSALITEGVIKACKDAGHDVISKNMQWANPEDPAVASCDAIIFCFQASWFSMAQQIDGIVSKVVAYIGKGSALMAPKKIALVANCEDDSYVILSQFNAKFEAIVKDAPGCRLVDELLISGTGALGDFHKKTVFSNVNELIEEIGK